MDRLKIWTHQVKTKKNKLKTRNFIVLLKEEKIQKVYYHYYYYYY